MLSLKGVSHIYPNGTRALDNATLDIPTGMFGLLGPNGAGKSTLMRCIATLQTPSEGQIRFGDIDAIAQPQALRDEFAPRVVQVTLHERKFADQGCQRGFRVVEQHDADGADHHVLLVTQRNAADDKRAGTVGEQIDEVGFSCFQHAAHLRVGDHVLHHVTDELVHRGIPEGG